MDRPRRGQYAIILALGLVPMIGVGALSLDLSMASTLTSQADAVAFAAAQTAIVAYNENKTVGEATAMAETLVDTYPTLMNGERFVLNGIDWGYVDRTTGQLVVDPGIEAARARVSRIGDDGLGTMFGRLFGIRSIDIWGSGVSDQLPSDFARGCDALIPFAGSTGAITRNDFDAVINVPLHQIPASGWYAVYKGDVAESGPSQRNESSYYRVYNDRKPDGLPRSSTTNCGQEYVVRDYDNEGETPDRVLLGEFFFDADSPNVIQMRHYCAIVDECPEHEDFDAACGDSFDSIHFNRGDANLCLEAL